MKPEGPVWEELKDQRATLQKQPCPKAGLRLRARMIGMIGVIILVAREIIPMTRMIAQIYKNTMGK